MNKIKKTFAIIANSIVLWFLAMQNALIAIEIPSAVGRVPDDPWNMHIPMTYTVGWITTHFLVWVIFPTLIIMGVITWKKLDKMKKQKSVNVANVLSREEARLNVRLTKIKRYGLVAGILFVYGLVILLMYHRTYDYQIHVTTTHILIVLQMAIVFIGSLTLLCIIRRKVNREMDEMYRQQAENQNVKLENEKGE